MDRRRAIAGLLAALAVLAFVVAAATIDSPGGTGGSGIGDSDEGGAVGGVDVSPRDPVDDATLPDPLRYLLAALLALGILVSVVNFYREYGVRGIVGITFAGVVLGALLYLILSGFEPPGPQASNGSTGAPVLPSGGDPGTGGEDGVPTRTVPVFAGVFLLALLGGGLLLVRATGDETRAADPTTDEAPEAEQLGRVAGEAADRIVRGAVTDNEVYRAWRAMTEQLDVANPDASTPGEFADAAVEAGLAREDVEELTALFAAVRYGEREATADREERAVAALRRIEEGYA